MSVAETFDADADGTRCGQHPASQAERQIGVRDGAHDVQPARAVAGLGVVGQRVRGQPPVGVGHEREGVLRLRHGSPKGVGAATGKPVAGHGGR